MMIRMNMCGFLAALLAGCGLPATPSDVKMAGVGLDPDEIGALPDMHGGLIEYNLFDFAGSQLPLGLLGLVSYDQVGADVGFSPPYKMVVGQGFVFQDDLGNPDALFGTLTKPPDAIGVCQTRYEPRSYLSGLADVGNRITFSTPGGEGGWSIGRRPYVYPPDVRDVFTYYFELDAWRADARVRPVQIDANNSIPTSLDDQVLMPANFPEGELIEVNFPGGIPPMEASIGSIPVPLASTGESREIVLPHSPMGVRIGWNGPRYDSLGRLADASSAEGSDGGDTGAVPSEGNSTCFQYLAHDVAPVTAEDCVDLQEAPNTPAGFTAIGGDYESRSLPGQMYTGPWDTDDQELVFEWVPGAEANEEIVTLTIRFLGAVDRTDENLVEGIVKSSSNAPNADIAWAAAQDAGQIPDGASIPVGRRAATSCDVPYEMEDPALIRDNEVTIDWPLDDAHTYEDDSFIPSLHGDPSHTVAEVTCRLDDSKGRFVLTQEVMEKAMDFAATQGAEGSVFFFSRSTEAALQTPPVRDRYGNRHDISAVKMVGRSVQVGRFWYGQ